MTRDGVGPATLPISIAVVLVTLLVALWLYQWWVLAYWPARPERRSALLRGRLVHHYIPTRHLHVDDITGHVRLQPRPVTLVPFLLGIRRFWLFVYLGEGHRGGLLNHGGGRMRRHSPWSCVTISGEDLDAWLTANSTAIGHRPRDGALALRGGYSGPVLAVRHDVDPVVERRRQRPERRDPASDSIESDPPVAASDHPTVDAKHPENPERGGRGEDSDDAWSVDGLGQAEHHGGDDPSGRRSAEK